MTRRSLPVAPSLSVNLYADDVLADSRDVFARIREAGPVVWLPRHRMYAIGRFADVRAALRNDAVYRSGAGVAANRLSNHLGRHTTLFSDDEARTRRRKVLMRSLAAKALVDIEPQVDARADALIERLLATDWFEAATDFSAHLPIGVVAELVGGPEGGERLLRWAAATFDALGPMNRRGLRSARTSLGLLLYTLRFSTAGVSPRSWAAAVFAARDRGQITTRQAQGLVIDFVAPSLDTTILASTHLLWVLSRHADVWDEIVADLSLIPAAVVENVRIASPIRGFTRRLSRDHEIGGTLLPRGSRVVLLFGAANLDETRFPKCRELRHPPAERRARRLGKRAARMRWRQPCQARDAGPAARDGPPRPPHRHQQTQSAAQQHAPGLQRAHRPLQLANSRLTRPVAGPSASAAVPPRLRPSPTGRTCAALPRHGGGRRPSVPVRPERRP